MVEVKPTGFLSRRVTAVREDRVEGRSILCLGECILDVAHGHLAVRQGFWRGLCWRPLRDEAPGRSLEQRHSLWRRRKASLSQIQGPGTPVPQLSGEQRSWTSLMRGNQQAHLQGCVPGCPDGSSTGDLCIDPLWFLNLVRERTQCLRGHDSSHGRRDVDRPWLLVCSGG
ncbi:uncharacterized protein LOC131818168 isoform X3 [Mustela lutreola]|uniref:uncharacterized protein LOC131818168 isoform X3 n=1 Tax=Mustela lutreola TaxID=9666 RepID=UPI0027971CFD|nr:uncharacterized protein LOC131818168 isoform X3 [Mustela lutreola]